MKTLGIVLAVAVALAIGVGAGYWFARRPVREAAVVAEPEKALYHCPMHPQVVSDRPGTCPICGMTLVARDTSVGPAAARKKTVYRSTMLPNEVSDHPGKDSMGMEMVPVEVDQPTSAAGNVTGRAAVTLTDRGRQLIGAQTEVVGETPIRRSIRAVGQVAYDETRMFHVHTKIQGWIEHVFAGAAGDVVRLGDPLLEIYSPDLLASQQEYLVALDNRTRVADATLPGVRDNAQSLVDAARKRLALQDLTDGQIEDLVRTRQAQKTVILYAPLSGTITARNVSHGERIESETSLLDIADLSKVWVLASIYEYDLPFVRVGQEADITLSYLPGLSFHGRIALVSPLVDATTRTIQVRIELENAGLVLKPGMFADVRLTADLGRGLTVPKDAVLRTGGRDLVFVNPSDGVFQPREVTLGLALPDRYEVTGGLAAGERVLSAAAFFVDSESRLKSALGAAVEPAP
jgi:Cu(I)/Ag(I) efflux system membrane fusion protein/cobalt-zinc-cadmium efflux system membrane fusion protein